MYGCLGAVFRRSRVRVMCVCVCVYIYMFRSTLKILCYLAIQCDNL